jgi:acyl-CoA synthetase (AMP-forming)/AMP-acid ligase II
MNISMLLDMAADAFGDRAIVGRRTGALTVRDVDRLAAGGSTLITDTAADSLIYLGVNGPCFPAALFAAARAGVPLVPLNYRLGAQQLQTLLRNHPKAIGIADPRSAELLGPTGIPLRTPDRWLADATQRDSMPAAESPQTPAVVIYTSGTTSEPKGVLLGHDNLVSYVLRSVEFASAEPGEASLVSVPPYHIAAVANVLTNLYAGRRSLALDQFDGGEWLEVARAEEVTHAMVVPTMLARIMAVKADRSVPSLRTLAYGGAIMSRKVIESALEAWPRVNFVNAYGLTETSSTISVLGPQDHRAALSSADPADRARLSSAGLPLPGVELQIRDTIGEVMPAGVTGRIWVRGEQVSGRYLGAGSVLDQDGFFDTRDEGFLDRDGYLFVSGRADDTIIRGGENIAPAEIEATLLLHEGIDDAVVVGLPDPEWGQQLTAVIVAKPHRVIDADCVRAFVRERLRSSKTPQRIEVWSELPRTETGKIVRRQVIDLLSDG